MNIQNIEYFIYICENNYNITKASKNLHISQPALSKMLIGLEDSLEAILFVRDKGRLVGLTEAGKIVLESYKEVNLINKQMRKKIKESQKIKLPIVRIGISPYIIDIILGKYLNEIYDNEKYRIEFIEAIGEDLINKFENNIFDILISLNNYNMNKHNYYSERIVADEYIAIVNKDSLLNRKEKLHWSDLKNYTIAIPAKGNQINTQIMRILDKENIPIFNLLSIPSITHLIEIVHEKDIITVLPKIFYEKYKNKEDIKIIHFEKPKFWEVDINILRENRIEDSVIFEILGKIKKLIKKNFSQDLV